MLRAHVELQQEQQQLIAQENQLAKDKLALGRVIGLPSGQQFTIADTETLLAAGCGDLRRGPAGSRIGCAVANDSLVGALYATIWRKLELARALGATEQRIRNFMEVK